MNRKGDLEARANRGGSLPVSASSELHAMALAHFNEPIIAMARVVRLIGYGEDERDCYLICREMYGKTVWHTCVGGYTFLDRLKGQGYVKAPNGEGWDDLTRLDSVLAINGCPHEAEFVLDIRPDEVGHP